MPGNLKPTCLDERARGLTKTVEAERIRTPEGVKVENKIASFAASHVEQGAWRFRRLEPENTDLQVWTVIGAKRLIVAPADAFLLLYCVPESQLMLGDRVLQRNFERPSFQSFCTELLVE